MIEKEFWEILGDIFEVSDIPCYLCPVFIYNKGLNECGGDCGIALEIVHERVMKRSKK